MRVRQIPLLAAALAILAAGGFPASALPSVPDYPLDGSVMDSGRPGPLVLIVAGLHGDEPSGMIAANVIIGRHGAARPGGAKGLLKGSLVVVPAANPAAVASGSRTGPSGLDMNRLFPGGSGSEEGRRSIGIFRTGERSDLVLDLHEEGLAWPEADLPTLVTNASSAALALDLIDELSAEGFAFTGGAPEGSLVAELGKRNKAALTIEVPARLGEAERVRLQLLAIDAALRHLGLIK